MKIEDTIHPSSFIIIIISIIKIKGLPKIPVKTGYQLGDHTSYYVHGIYVT